MKDREKVINGLEKEAMACGDYIQLPLRVYSSALAMLKEQEKQKFFVDENGKITPIPVVVRCKDCKHWEQSNGHCPFNSIFTNADWFCADGRRDE